MYARSTPPASPRLSSESLSGPGSPSSSSWVEGMARGKGRSAAPRWHSPKPSLSSRGKWTFAGQAGSGLGTPKGLLGFGPVNARRGGKRWLMSPQGIGIAVMVVLYLLWRHRSSGVMLPLEPTSQPVVEDVRAPPHIRPPTANKVPTKPFDPPDLSPSSPGFVDLSPSPYPHPPPSRSSQDFKTRKYLSYFPHSGYHNQRLALENALTLAALLDRTLLLPPVWLGHAIPYISFDKLERRVATATKTGLEHCRSWAEPERSLASANEDWEDGPLPRECVGFFEFTTVNWDFLVDLPSFIDPPSRTEGNDVPGVEVVSRSNFSSAWLTDALGLSLPRDAHYLKDSTPYAYKIYSDSDDLHPLDKFENRINIADLRKPPISNKRLLGIGSLFGTSRLRTTDEASANVRSAAREAMVFRHPLLDQASDEISRRLGGPPGYYGVHVRIGDGVFRQGAEQNVREIVSKLVIGKMKLAETVLDKALRSSGMKVEPRKQEDAQAKLDPNASKQPAAQLRKRENSRPQRPGAYDHPPLPPIPPIDSRADSPLHRTLSCRGRFHASPDLVPFNAPLFLATDSAMPETDPVLAVFFRLFPCTFHLGDFFHASQVNAEPVAALGEISRVRNSEDRVELGGFLIPFVDAMVAAKGRAIVGTTGSTFSRFAADVLHQKYHGWPIIERG